MAWIIVVLLVALAVFIAWNAKTPEGWDWKKGLAALAALGGAVWTWVSGLTDKF